MSLLTRQQILEVEDIKTEDVEVPEWGGTVRVRGLSGTGRDAWETEMFGKDGKSTTLENARAKLVSRCLVDEEGQLIFTGADITALGKKSAVALDRVFTVCKRLNGIGKEDLDEIVGNSNSGPSEDSTSA
jgi:hypothetical protein